MDEDDDSKIVSNVENNTASEISIDYNEFLSVIIARQEEILESIFLPLRLQDSQFSYQISTRKIIITGGGSKIQGLSQMIGDFYPCKLIKTAEFFGVNNIEVSSGEFNKNDQSFATIIGAMKYIKEELLKGEDTNSFTEERRKFSLKKFFSFAVKN